MTTSKITITPTSNIENSQVVDIKLVTTESHDSRDLKFILRNTINNITRRGDLINVSIYDDVIVRGSNEFKILNMLTK